VSPVRYELGLYIAEDGILHSHCCENFKYYMGTENTASYRNNTMMTKIFWEILWKIFFQSITKIGNSVRELNLQIIKFYWKIYLNYSG
jgi:hypothetical protein